MDAYRVRQGVANTLPTIVVIIAAATILLGGTATYLSGAVDLGGSIIPGFGDAADTPGDEGDDGSDGDGTDTSGDGGSGGGSTVTWETLETFDAVSGGPGARLTFSEEMDAGSVETVDFDFSSLPVESATVSGADIVLTTSTGIAPGDGATLTVDIIGEVASTAGATKSGVSCSDTFNDGAASQCEGGEDGRTMDASWTQFPSGTVCQGETYTLAAEAADSAGNLAGQDFSIEYLISGFMSRYDTYETVACSDGSSCTVSTEYTMPGTDVSVSFRASVDTSDGEYLVTGARSVSPEDCGDTTTYPWGAEIEIEEGDFFLFEEADAPDGCTADDGHAFNASYVDGDFNLDELSEDGLVIGGRTGPAEEETVEFNGATFEVRSIDRSAIPYVMTLVATCS